MYKVNKDFDKSLYTFQCTIICDLIDFVHILVYNIIVERGHIMPKSKNRRKKQTKRKHRRGGVREPATSNQKNDKFIYQDNGTIISYSNNLISKGDCDDEQ